MNYWITLEDAAKRGKNVFSPFTCTDDINIKYDILEMNFQISCKLYWFWQNLRRNEDVEMSLLYSNVIHNISLEEIFSIPLFKKETISETNEINKAYKIQKLISENVEIKKAMALKYAQNLGCAIYANENVSPICKILDRFGKYSDVLKYKENALFGNIEDDFSGITDISKCIISTY